MKYEKIAPGLASAFTDFQQHGRAGLIQHNRLIGISSLNDLSKPLGIPVFIRCDPQADLKHLAKYNIQVNQPKGRIRTAFLPLEGLEPLSEDSEVERVVPSRYLRPLMDVAPGAVRLPVFVSSEGFHGNGVVIGVVDTGIDSTHPVFAGRILEIWDQDMPGSGVLEGAYGMELKTPNLALSRDMHGHGTHVAGIAAGLDGKYAGVAPAADLVIVKTDFKNTHIADGIRYIFRVASELGKPAVVNLSLGGHGDAHDGSDDLSQIIDDESGPGRIVCCAAGNEGNDNIHAQATVTQGNSTDIRFTIPSSSIASGSIFGCLLNGWYSGIDQLSVAVQSPGGFQTTFQDVITSGNPSRTYDLPEGRVKIETPLPDPANGDHNFLIEISNFGTPLKAGTWRLLLKGQTIANGVVDVWALDSSDELDVTFANQIQDSMKIGSPGASGSAITVGSYTTKTQWQDTLGNPRQVGLTLNEISSFSSEGPLRNGHRKPDVAAPGAMIVSALSSASQVNPAMTVDPRFRLMAGTSMATPFISGLVALLLQKNPQSTPTEIRDLLKGTCVVPGLLAGTFDSKWGFGLIDAGNL